MAAAAGAGETPAAPAGAGLVPGAGAGMPAAAAASSEISPLCARQAESLSTLVHYTRQLDGVVWQHPRGHLPPSETACRSNTRVPRCRCML